LRIVMSAMAGYLLAVVLQIRPESFTNRGRSRPIYLGSLGSSNVPSL
jgi:hypothetical protein